MYGFQSYISMPIFLKDGSFYGTLCAIDPSPAKLKNDGIIGMFRLFAELIGGQLETVLSLASAEAELIDVREASVLREQFIAVLGHDLRNPLASIDAGIKLLQKPHIDEKSMAIIGLMQKSVERMTAIINDVLDFARGRLGGGIPLKLTQEPIDSLLLQVIRELQLSHPDNAIETDLHLDRQVVVDRERIGQLFSNLLGNALTHGHRNAPVKVRARTSDERLEISVSNEGQAIPSGILARLFLPFARGEQSAQQGLGLGLYIASEIAKAHGGKITVQSSADQTTFSFAMPLRIVAETHA